MDIGRSQSQRWSALLTLLVAAFAGPRASAQDTPLSTLEERAFQQAAAIADPSIVRIETIGGVDVIGEMVAAAGPTTGVIVDPEGWIITSSFNFAAQPASVFVTTAENQRFPATITGRDESRQLTLLKIDAAGLKPLTAVPKNELRVGMWSIALGRTFDLAFPNIAVGIVSALNRISGRAIQTDANTSPVNYGGPLIDIQGRGLGIIVPLSPQGDEVTAGVEYYDSGIGFAVPLADVIAVLDQLKAGKTLKPGKLGIFFAGEGVLSGQVKVDRVHPRSPADEAGIKVGDVILGLDGKEIDRAAILRQVLGPRYGGEKVTLKVRRGDQTLDVPVTLAEEITPVEYAFLGVLPERPAKDGAAAFKARQVLADSPAAKSGIKPDDVISGVDGEPATARDAVVSKLRKHVPGDKVSVQIGPPENSRTVELVATSFPTDVPTEVPAQPIPAGSTDAKDAPKVGRIVDQIVGDERRYWGYVPEHYNPLHPYGLVVWLHPNSDRREASTLERWRSICEERGLIIVAPPAGNEGWVGEDIPFVVGVIARIREQYHVDPQRIVAVGEAEGGRLAVFLGLRQRDVFTGVAAFGAQLPPKLPDSESDRPLRFYAGVFESDPQAGRIERAVAPLRAQKQSVIFRKWPGNSSDGPPQEAVSELGRWIDLLDAV